MTSLKRVQWCRVGVIFGLALIFNIGLLHSTYAEEAIIFRKGEVPNAFGYAVDVSDDTLIVGAPTKENGEVYIFARQGDQWVQQARIKTPRPNPGGWFGGAVCIDGDTAAVGTRTVFNDTRGFTAGSGVVYIYQREGKNFVLKQKLSPEDAQDGERFGFAVDLSGDTLVVGSPFHGDGGGPDLGVAYAYVREKEGFQHQRTFFGGGGRDLVGLSVLIETPLLLGRRLRLYLLQMTVQSRFMCARGNSGKSRHGYGRRMGLGTGISVGLSPSVGIGSLSAHRISGVRPPVRRISSYAKGTHGRRS